MSKEQRNLIRKNYSAKVKKQKQMGNSIGNVGFKTSSVH